MSSLLLKPKTKIEGKYYSVLNLLGEGAFGYVSRVKSINIGDFGQRYAVKKMIIQTEEQMEEARKEIVELQSYPSHPNILQLLAFDEKVNKRGQAEFQILLPLYPASVQSVIDSKGKGYPFCAFADGAAVFKILQGILSGLLAMHRRGVRHNDIKPGNVLLTATGEGVLADLGSTCPLVTQVASRRDALKIQDYASTHSTASYRAPELIETPSECVIDGKADVWAVGCTLHAIMFSRSPFESSASDGFSVLAALSANWTIPPRHPWPPSWIDALGSCLKANSAERLGVVELLDKIKSLQHANVDVSKAQEWGAQAAPSHEEGGWAKFE